MSDPVRHNHTIVVKKPYNKNLKRILEVETTGSIPMQILSEQVFKYLNVADSDSPLDGDMTGVTNPTAQGREPWQPAIIFKTSNRYHGVTEESEIWTFNVVEDCLEEDLRDWVVDEDESQIYCEARRRT